MYAQQNGTSLSFYCVIRTDEVIDFLLESWYRENRDNKGAPVMWHTLGR